jgi:predicted nucleic acid-binding protein
VALIARYLIDTSAAARMRVPEVSRRLRPLIEGGLVGTTASLDAEALYSARDPRPQDLATTAVNTNKVGPCEANSDVPRGS